MKLRNKKTGEIIDLSKGLIMDSMNGREIILKSKGTTYGETYGYHSLAELCAEWEDYKPAEPLIKDEKIRKTVKTWAELNSIEKVTYAESEREDGCLFILTDMSDGDYVIELAGWVPTLIDDNEYTIAELCGEEEG